MDSPKIRKISRRSTEISRDSIKLIDENGIEARVQTAPGEIFDYLSRIVNPESCSKDTLFHSAVKLLKICSKSTWVELFLLKQNSLKNYSPNAKPRYLNLDPEDNLLSYAVSNKKPVLISNPHTSTKYSKFPTKLQGFSILTNLPIKTYGTACIPLTDNSNSIYGVVQLFNKIDSLNSQSFYSEEDTALVYCIGKLLGEIFKTRDFYKQVKNHNNGLISLIEQQRKSWKSVNSISKREIMFEKLIKMLKNQSDLDESLLKYITKTMDCDRVSVFFSCKGELQHFLSYGAEDDYKRIEKIVENCCFTKEIILNIRNLHSEPLIRSEFKSELSCCLISSTTLSTGNKLIVCLMRKSTEFSRHDQSLLEKISKELSLYTRIATNSRLKVKINMCKTSLNLRKNFSLPKNLDFNYYQFFYNTKEALGIWFNLSSCSLYIADQANEQLWTKNSMSSSELLHPFSQMSLIGKTYEDCEIISLPNPELFMLSDLDIYKDRFVVSLPISSSSFKDPVIGVLVCTRKETRFSELETWLIEKYTENLAEILERLYISSLPLCNETEENGYRGSLAVSPNTMFRKVNMKKMNFPSDVLGEENLDLAVNQVVTSFSSMTAEKINKLQKLLLEVEKSKDPQGFFSDLHEVVDCEISVFYNFCGFSNKLQDMFTKEKLPLTQLSEYCIQEKTAVYVQDGIVSFPKDWDLFGVSSCDENYLYAKEKKSFVFMPVISKLGSVIGVLHFVNFYHNLTEQDIKAIESLSMFASLLCLDVHSKKWEEIIEETRHQHELQQWSSLLIQVANSSILKMLECRSAIYQFVNSKDIKEIMKTCMKVLCIVMDCNKAEIIIEVDGSVCRITESGYKFLDLNEKEYQELQKQIQNKKIIKNEIPFSITVPFEFKNLEGFLKLENSDSSKKYKDFRISDESILVELCKKISEAIIEFPNTTEDTLNELSQYIKRITLSYKPIALNYVINNASKSLVDGDRAVFFSLKDGNLTALDQGIEYEIPRDFSVAEGKDIVFHVFSNQKSEIIQDVYSDERFDPVLDKLTGYKTDSMICTPLITQFNKFGAIEVLNKRHSKFTRKDIELLEKFGNLVCMVLEIINNMQNTLEEHYRLFSISSILETYILVFNEEQKVIYINKPIDLIFGVSQEQIMDLTYFAWMHGNKQLMEDLQLVFNNSSLEIRKNSQKIKTRKNSHVSASRHIQDFKYINYRISHLKNFSSECVSGVILIIEDATKNLESLHNEFKNFQKEIRTLAAPIGAETKLQKCIRELSVAVSRIDDISAKENIFEVIAKLKTGGLKKHKVKIDVEEPNMGAIKSMLGIPNSILKRNSILKAPKEEMVSNHSVIPLSELRNWDLNSISMDNHYDFVCAMLENFDIFQHFQLRNEILFNFTGSIKEKCNHRNNPFHNFNHCFSVMHGTYMLLSSTPAGGHFNVLQIDALLIAALCHDVDHRARGNMFEVYSRSEIATTYHDKSVLEQHHAAVTFFTLQEKDCNIFESLSTEKFNQARKLIITAILGTDMSKHLVMLENLAARSKDIETKPMGSCEKDIEKFSQLILHAADLSHPCKSPEIYQFWSMLVNQEFTDQYNDEVSRGLPITEFMKNLHLPQIYYKNEIGFLSFVVKPLWNCLNLFLAPSIDNLLDKIQKNISALELELKKWEEAGK